MDSPRRVARSLALGHPRIVDRVEPWWRHAGCESAEEREGIHVNRDRPIGVGLLQRDAHQTVGTLFHPLLGNRRTQDIAQQCLATLRVNPARAGPPRGGFALAACRVNPSSEAHSGLS